MRDIPQSNLLNPGQIPQTGTFLGLPLISGVRLGAGSSDLNYHDFDTLIADGEDERDYQALRNRLPKDRTSMLFDSEVRLFSLGTRLGKGYVSVDIGDVFYLSGNSPREVFDLLADTQQGPYAGAVPPIYYFSALDFNGAYYRSFSLAYGRSVLSGLTVGGRIRWLQVMGGIWTENHGLTFYTPTDGSTFGVSGQLNILTSGLFGGEDESIGSRLFSGGNNGFAVDIGGVYQISDKVELSFSALNLGQISWKKQVYTAIIDDQVSFSSEDPDDFIEQWKTAIDDQLGEMPAYPVMQFTTPLPQKFYIGARYAVTPKTSLGFLSNIVFYNRRTDLAFSLSGQTRLGKVLGLSAAASYTQFAPFNLGVGLSVDLGILQLYAIADNLPAALSWRTSRAPQGQFGINLIFGRNKQAESLPEPPVADTESEIPVALDTVPESVAIVDTPMVTSPPPEEMQEESPPAQAETLNLPEKQPEPNAALPDESSPAFEEEVVDFDEPAPMTSPMEVAPMLADGETTFKITANTKLWEGPIHTSDVLENLRAGDQIEVVKKTGKWWWKVRFGDKVGFVRTMLLASMNENR